MGRWIRGRVQWFHAPWRGTGLGRPGVGSKEARSCIEQQGGARRWRGRSARRGLVGGRAAVARFDACSDRGHGVRRSRRFASPTSARLAGGRPGSGGTGSARGLDGESTSQGPKRRARSVNLRAPIVPQQGPWVDLFLVAHPVPDVQKLFGARGGDGCCIHAHCGAGGRSAGGGSPCARVAITIKCSVPKTAGPRSGGAKGVSIRRCISGHLPALRTTGSGTPSTSARCEWSACC